MYKELKFDLTRNSLRYLIQTYKIKEIHIPYYLCDVIRHTVVEAGCKPLFYHIDDYFMPAKAFDKDDYILYPNYFGICDKNVNKLEKIYPKLIVDNAHAFYLPPQGFACFNAEHKFNPDKICSYLWIKEKAGIQESTPALKGVFVMKKFNELHRTFAEVNNIKIDIKNIKSPFCYPCLLSTDKEADELAGKLTKEGKTIYRYWNPLPKSYNEYKFYRRLVPIPLN